MAEPTARSVVAFIGLVIGCGVLIAATAALTRERIEENRARRFLATLAELTGSPAAAVRWTGNVGCLVAGEARDDGRPVLLRGAAGGYGGDIRWLAAVDTTAPAPTLERLRITAHQETPGIAGFLDRPHAGWLAGLAGRDAHALADVDAVSGATITSRALTRDLSRRLDKAALAGACAP